MEKTKTLMTIRLVEMPALPSVYKITLDENHCGYIRREVEEGTWRAMLSGNPEANDGESLMVAFDAPEDAALGLAHAWLKANQPKEV